VNALSTEVNLWITNIEDGKIEVENGKLKGHSIWIVDKTDKCCLGKHAHDLEMGNKQLS